MVGCWRGCLSGATCRLAYGSADATATHKIGFTFLVLAHPGRPGQWAVRHVCLCVSSLSDHLQSAAVHLQRYLNCDTAAVLPGCTYADLWALVARVINISPSFQHLDQINNSSTSTQTLILLVSLECMMLFTSM